MTEFGGTDRPVPQRYERAIERSNQVNLREDSMPSAPELPVWTLWMNFLCG